MKMRTEINEIAWAIRRASAEKINCKITEIPWIDCLNKARKSFRETEQKRIEKSNIIQAEIERINAANPSGDFLRYKHDVADDGHIVYFMAGGLEKNKRFKTEYEALICLSETGTPGEFYRHNLER